MTIASADRKRCCALAYASPAAALLLGDSFHPGGAALTAELVSALGVGPGHVVADVASGRGTSAIAIARSTGCDVVGFDLVPENVAAAALRATEAGLARRVRFVAADAEALPLPDESVDGVLCECAFCLFPDKAAAAREIARVLRPGARLALSDVTVEPARLPAELRGLDAYVACIADARPLDETAAILAAAGLVVESTARRDGTVARLIERVADRLRLARLVAGAQSELFARADTLVAAALAAVRDGSLGYGAIVARRPH